MLALTALRAARMLRRGCLFLFLFFFLAACAPDPTGPSLGEATSTTGPAVLAIRTGSYFGHCVGYCQDELALTAERITYERRSNNPDDSDHPTIRMEDPIDENTWNQMTESIDLSSFNQLAERIGCPDCADGGGEWVEIETGAGIHRVEFEYGADIDELMPLLSQLRELRETYASQAGE